MIILLLKNRMLIGIPCYKRNRRTMLIIPRKKILTTRNRKNDLLKNEMKTDSVFNLIRLNNINSSGIV